MEEIWKDVVGYEQIYEVSNYGRVRTHKNKKTWSKQYNSWRYWKQRYLKDKTPNGRDYRVALWKDGKVKYYLVHRLVAQAFIPMEIEKSYVNHIDGNSKNNHVENLEWCTKADNNKHAFATNLMTAQKSVVLINTDSKTKHEFKSLQSASYYLGRKHGYLSSALKRGKTTVTDINGNNYSIVQN